MKGWRRGAASAFIILSLPIDGCLCPEARPLPVRTEYICASLSKAPFLPSHQRPTSPTHASQDLLDDLNLLQSLYL